MTETQLHVVMAKGDSVLVDPVYQTPGLENNTDLATRGKASIKDVDMGSTWQTSLEYLRESRESWQHHHQYPGGLQNQFHHELQQQHHPGPWSNGQVHPSLCLQV